MADSGRSSRNRTTALRTNGSSPRKAHAACLLAPPRWPALARLKALSRQRLASTSGRPGASNGPNDAARRFQDTSTPTTGALDVAEAVWRAATDPSSPVRIPAGAEADAWEAEPR